ncbi:MAG TPA: hypothetical protein ENK43_10750 [Planctomycetes bacterium]|nr:hypothetical protein [Planctomycetota bacterium]
MSPDRPVGHHDRRSGRGLDGFDGRPPQGGGGGRVGGVAGRTAGAPQGRPRGSHRAALPAAPPLGAGAGWARFCTGSRHRSPRIAGSGRDRLGPFRAAAGRVLAPHGGRRGAGLAGHNAECVLAFGAVREPLWRLSVRLPRS